MPVLEDGIFPAEGAILPKSGWIVPLEVFAAVLIAGIVLLLFGGVVSRYVFSSPIGWIDETVSMAFIWVGMIGAAIAMYRHEHLRLATFVDMLPPRKRDFVNAVGLVCVAAFLIALIPPAIEHAKQEWVIEMQTLHIPNTFRVSAIAAGALLMLAVVLMHAVRTVPKARLAAAVGVVGAAALVFLLVSPSLSQFKVGGLVFFLAGLVALLLAAGVPIAFCFGLGVMAYLAFGTTVPVGVVVGRMDEGMSNLVLVSVPVFVLLGCILDATGMGKVIVDVLAALIGHIKAGMSYVLLGSLFIVSGISGSKVSDMATVAPALFPEMTRRGNKRPEMVALLGTGAAMADTVPPSIVLIVLGSVAGVSIAGLFQSGFVIAMVLLLTLVAVARWKARNEQTDGTKRPPWKAIGRLTVIAAPALALPFLIRSAVGEGVATATEVSTIAVLYALIVGHVLYGGIRPRKLYGMLVETAALSGAILMILGTASAMAWSITQSGVVHAMSQFLATLPGGAIAFMAASIVIFVVLGCLLEGLPAVLLLAPIMFPIAKRLGIHDIQYAMVIVSSMNIGLMLPPVGVGFYVACRIGEGRPEEVMRAIWPYMAALLVGVIVIATVPTLSTIAL
ncbi:TRAP transporter large permease subunit [Ramlibacter sp. 2FC]|uniref:TRAP transporter large permease n=1 Tax=Ramlibacter sp. 2FC TaxID=2502188 RepID=UPI0010F8C205|nr:TRAP transporter large permease subunit [Ramlibacter sp. 2FC]